MTTPHYNFKIRLASSSLPTIPIHRPGLPRSHPEAASNNKFAKCCKQQFDPHFYSVYGCQTRGGCEHPIAWSRCSCAVGGIAVVSLWCRCAICADAGRQHTRACVTKLDLPNGCSIGPWLLHRPNRLLHRLGLLLHPPGWSFHRPGWLLHRLGWLLHRPNRLLPSPQPVSPPPWLLSPSSWLVTPSP